MGSNQRIANRVEQFQCGVWGLELTIMTSELRSGDAICIHDWFMAGKIEATPCPGSWTVRNNLRTLLANAQSWHIVFDQSMIVLYPYKDEQAKKEIALAVGK